jgi:hypothetical protein
MDRKASLSRRKQGFDSPWERQKSTVSMGLFAWYPLRLSTRLSGRFSALNQGRDLDHSVARLSLAVGLLAVEFRLF